jgi:ubiquinone/menaquinone biosynthesis C-methylase UbiE
MTIPTDILQCPVTGRDLHWASNGQLSASDGPSYTVIDGIAGLLPPALGAITDGVREFYDASGWIADDKGMFGETKAFSDTRSQSQAFTNRCIARMGRYFDKRGKYILDAGSGPIVYDGYLTYGEQFEKRVCVDLSIKGLHAAKQKLGDSGIYLQGDLTNLPLKTGSMDAITCNHVIYQLPVELQAPAMLELWRVLKPGGVAVIVYLSPKAPLERRFRKLAKLLFGEQPATPASHAADNEQLPHNPMPLSWFEGQKWPFTYKLDSFRPWGQGFMRENLPDNWQGRAFMNAFYMLQSIAPGFFARYGLVPTFVIRKPLNAS